MKQTLYFSLAEIKAMRNFCSVDESRFVLNGINFETQVGKLPLMVATDGRSLAVLEGSPEQNPVGVENASVILSTQALNRIPACAKKSEIVGIEFREKSIALSLGEFDTTLHRKFMIEGNFPNWRQVIPQVLDMKREEWPCVNGFFVEKFHKAAAMLGSPTFTFRFSGKASAMTIEMEKFPRFVGVLMPIKDEVRSNQSLLNRIQGK